MVTKQLAGLQTPDSGFYGTVTDGNGNLVSTSTSSLSTAKQLNGLQSPDGSLYVTLTNGSGNLI
jgi:hypothetical protein